MAKCTYKLTEELPKKLSNLGTIPLRTLLRLINSNPKIKYIGSGNNGHWKVED